MRQSAAWTVPIEYTREGLHEENYFGTQTIRFLHSIQLPCLMKNLVLEGTLSHALFLSAFSLSFDSQQKQGPSMLQEFGWSPLK